MNRLSEKITSKAAPLRPCPWIKTMPGFSGFPDASAYIFVPSDETSVFELAGYWDIVENILVGNALHEWSDRYKRPSTGLETENPAMSGG